MIKTASLNSEGNTKISEHFSVYETASTSPGPYAARKKIYSDSTKYDTDLVMMLEKLMIKIQAKAAYVTSWYRTPEHDRAVGGNGSGQHTLGKAVDIMFKDHHDNYIDARIISCVAQDIGFKGIARISDKTIHLDMRTSGTYFGDEMTGHTNTVTKDFRLYYGINEEQIAAVTGKLSNEAKKVEYFPKYVGGSFQLTTALNSLGIDSSKSYRAKVAAANSILDYSYTAEQNTMLLTLLRAGKLIKP